MRKIVGLAAFVATLGLVSSHRVESQGIDPLYKRYAEGTAESPYYSIRSSEVKRELNVKTEKPRRPLPTTNNIQDFSYLIGINR